MRLFLLAALGWLAATQVLARDALDVSKIPLDECHLRTAIQALTYKTIENQRAIAKQSSPILNKMAALNRKARHKNLPLIDQLSPTDLAEFSELGQSLLTMQLASLLESERERDLKIIERMVILADRYYRWQEVPSESEEDKFLFGTAPPFH